MTASEEIAAWALGLNLDDIPPEVRIAAKRHLLDGLGCALAASRLGEVPFAGAVARSFSGPEEATVIGDGSRIPSPAAAFANGALVHALDYDDTHAESLVHATAAVLPAAFAVGQERHVSGAEVLCACIAGYEFVIRLGAAVRHGFHAKGFHATSVCGVFAAALIAARLMKLDAAETVSAIGIAGSAASGSLEFLHTGSSTKQIHPGLSGMNGVIAARLAAEGATGPESILEGDYGLFRTFTDTTVDAPSLTKQLGSVWQTTRITIKPYPACQLSHASLDALASIRDQIGDLNSVDSIVFDVPRDSVPIISEPTAAKNAPGTAYEGKFSLPFCAASLLIEGGLGPDSFEPGRLTSPQTLVLAEKVGYRTTEPDVAAADAPGRVEVRLAAGRTLTGRVLASRGGPLLPLSADELTAKFVSNCGDAFPAEDISRAALALESLHEISELLVLTHPRALAR